MLCIQKCDMHLFQTEEQKQPIVYQVETGLFFKLDTLFQSILACCEGLSAAQVVQTLVEQYEAEEIVEAIEELAQVGLISDGALPVVSDVPTTEGVAACGVSQTDRLQVSLHVSHTCNIQCAYCFAHGGDYGGKAMLMQPDVAEQAIRWIVSEAQVFGRCQIDFFGGEPLLNFPLLRALVPFAKSLGVRLGVQVGFGIVTNGTLLTDEMKQFLVDEKFQIKVSLDGGRKTQDRIRKFHNGSGTYDVVAKNVKRLTAEAPERVYLQAVMTAYDMDEDQIADALRSLGTENALVGPAVVSPDAPYAIGEEHIPVLKQQIYRRSRHALKAMLNGEEGEDEEFDPRIQKLLTRQKSCHGCLGGKQYLAIAADGSIYFCSSLADAPEFKMGDVFAGIDREKQQHFDAQFNVNNRPECKTCWARNLCGGGCLWEARTTTGDPMYPNPVSCEQTRYRYELAMEMCMEIAEADASLLQRRYDLEVASS